MEDRLLALGLKWNNHKSTFFENLKILREKSNYTDATLAVEGKFYHVHKLVMITCSEYFSDIFERTSCKSPVIVLKDIRSQDIEALLDYIYLGEVNVNQNDLATFLKAAECLRIKGLPLPDENPTKLHKNSTNSHNDTLRDSPSSKKRRHDSSTIPTCDAFPIPSPQKSATASASVSHFHTSLPSHSTSYTEEDKSSVVKVEMDDAEEQEERFRRENNYENSTNSHNDTLWDTPSSKRRRHDSSTIPTCDAFPIPSPQKSTTASASVSHSHTLLPSHSTSYTEEDKSPVVKVEMDDAEEQDEGFRRENNYKGSAIHREPDEDYGSHIIKTEHELDVEVEMDDVEQKERSRRENYYEGFASSDQDPGGDIFNIEHEPENYGNTSLSGPLIQQSMCERLNMTSNSKTRCENSSGPYEYTQDDLEKAIKKYQSGGFSIRSVTKEFKIPESTFRQRMKEELPRECGRTNKDKRLLTDAQEEVLLNYIKGASKRVHPVTKGNVMEAVQLILEDELAMGIGRKNLKVDANYQDWWCHFKTRYPEIVYMTPETLSSARLNFSELLIRQWFSDVYAYFSQNDLLDLFLDPTRQFNIGETGFNLSPKIGTVVGIRGNRYCFKEQSETGKINISVLCTVGADGSLPPPMIIYPQRFFNIGMSQLFHPEYDFCVGKSEKGYINFETLYEYICNSFYLWLVENNIKRPVLVYSPWHENRNHFYLCKKMTELGIIMIGLLPNTTHIMQPLDVSVFKPVKTNWVNAIREYHHKNPDKVISQIDFAKVLIPLYYKVVIKPNIKAGFEKCGLYPWDPDSPDF